jgi:hypothetical protein
MSKSTKSAKNKCIHNKIKFRCKECNKSKLCRHNNIGRICNTCKMFPTIELEKLYNKIERVNFIEKTCKETPKCEKDNFSLLLEDILEKICNEKHDINQVLNEILVKKN